VRFGGLSPSFGGPSRENCAPNEFTYSMQSSRLTMNIMSCAASASRPVLFSSLVFKASRHPSLPRLISRMKSGPPATTFPDFIQHWIEACSRNHLLVARIFQKINRFPRTDLPGYKRHPSFPGYIFLGRCHAHRSLAPHPH